MNLWAPLEPANKLNPYPMYKLLREEAPIYKTQTGEWVFTRYEDVKSILTNRQCGSGNRKQWLERGVEYLSTKDVELDHIITAINNFILQLDPPAHTRIRKFVTENWDKEGVQNIIETNTDNLLSQITANEFDIIDRFASKLPSLTTAKIMGLPSEDHSYLHGLSSEMIKALDLYVDLKDLVRLNAASKEFIDYFRSAINSSHLQDGLIKHLLKINSQQEVPLTENELVSVFIFLFVASEETSVSFIGMAFYNVISNNLQAELISKNDIKIEIEELLRFESPAQLLGRIALEDITISGVKIKRGETLTLCIGAANRDPEVFPNPDQIILNRNPKHLAFGKGTHFCLGDWLAKSVGEIALRKGLKKFSNIQMVEHPQNWYNNIAIRGFRSLKVSTN